MVTMDSGPAFAPVSSPANSATGGGVPTWIYSLLWFLCAAILIGLGDRLLRRQENLAANLADSPVVIPFSDYLQEQVKRKSEWNKLLETRSKALAAGDVRNFAAITYAVADFAANIDALAPGRWKYWQDLVDRYGDSNEAVRAYFALLDPQWHAQVGPKYGVFTQKLLDLSAKTPDTGQDIQLGLAQVLQQDGETALEIKVLKVIFASQPVTFKTAQALQRLLDLLRPTDPDRNKLNGELAAFAAWHNEMLGRAKWYQVFEAARVNGKLEELIRLRAEMPSTPSDSFVASADAHLIDAYLMNGQYAEGRQLRETLARFDQNDLEDCSAIAMELSPPMASAITQKPAKLPPATLVPDNIDIQINRWRGFLDSGEQALARAVAATLFVGPEKKLAKPAADLAAAARGDRRKLSPIATFRPRTDGLPPELKGATDVSFAAIDLKPVGKGVPADVHARMEMWISRDLIVQIVTADEPRTPRPKPIVKKHDVDPWKEEYFEFFLSPDCWFNFYYQWAVTSAGVTWDARRYLSDPARLVFGIDKSLELGLKTTATQTPTGWTVRIVVPRKLLIPPGPAIVRFNVRRARHVKERNLDIAQFFSWGPTSATDHQPDRFGWLVVPQ